MTATADAGFVYQSAARGTEASVGGVVVQSTTSAAINSWFASSWSNSAAHSVLATHGSDLAADAMTFVGAAQVSASADATLAARSGATVTFEADATETVRWMADLWQEASGPGNTASIALAVTDLTTSSPELAFNGATLGSGSFQVTAGHTYRVTILALAGSVGSTNAVANYNVGLFTVPGPGALALLAIAAMAAQRRR
jgi:hypothetical protein